MNAYAIALYWLSPVLALTFWIGTVWLVRVSLRQRQFGRRLAAIAWAGHAAIWWTVSAGMRWIGSYESPTLLMSAWGTALFAHGAIGMLMMAALLDREG